MNAFLQLLAAALVSVSLSLLLLRILSAPLTRVLERVCQDADAAAFWRSYTWAMLTMSPLLVSLAVQMLWSASDPLDAFRAVLMASLGGLLLGLHVLGKRLVQFIGAPAGRGTP